MKRESWSADDWNMVQKYSDTVYRMAYSLVKNRYDADDIHQEVFVRYLCRKPMFENEEHERAWFLRVTINLCRNLWKTAWRRKWVSWEVYVGETKELGGAAEGAGEREGEDDEVIAAVKQLPQKYRIVVHLFYYEDLSTAEIARLLRIRESTVRTQLVRARKKLKGLLEEERDV
ncbi:MAG: sigma-70 family RNA polymerase sigma factor [bacterium]|nr:sigma-70 family RNA polymerase sigma factor [bacterium]